MPGTAGSPTTDEPAGRILVIDDNTARRTQLSNALGGQGFQAEGVGVADGLASPPAPGTVDVVIVRDDRIDGASIRICAALRARGSRPLILIVAEQATTADRIAGLDAGADDYISAPYEPAELFARVRTLLRHARPDTGSPQCG